jgi:NAD+ synthetase
MIKILRKNINVESNYLTRNLDYHLVLKNIISNIKCYINQKLKSLNKQARLFHENALTEKNLFKPKSETHEPILAHITDVNFILGVSGGIDSAIVNFIISMIFGGNKIFATSIPTKHNSGHTKDKAKHLSNLLNNNFEEKPIDVENDDGENDQSLKRALILQKKRDVLIREHGKNTAFLILNTSNISEIQTGNFTINGDTIGDFGILRNLFKSEVYQLIDFINSDNGKNFLLSELGTINNIEKILHCIDENSHIIPSAELKNNNQKDSDILLNHDDFYTVVDMILIGKMNSLNDEELKEALCKENAFAQWIEDFYNFKNIHEHVEKRKMADFAINKINARMKLSKNKINSMTCESIAI